MKWDLHLCKRSSLSTATQERTSLYFVISFLHRQHEGQNFYDFITELKKLSSECEFETLLDSLIKDIIVCDTNDNSLREHLLCESELTLPKAIYTGHAAEETCKHAHKILKSNETIDLHKISKHSKCRSVTSAQTTGIIKKCKFCESSHYLGKCPAYGKACHNVIRKIILKSAVHVIEKLSRKLSKLKLNHHLLTNTNFSLIW